MTVVHVAVGVILDEKKRILISRRDESAHQGGLWEFPGGKVEAGESLEQALARELLEELGITPAKTSPLLKVPHDYGDKHVLLDVCVVWAFTGEASGLEGQALEWISVERLEEFQFPAANKPIVEAVKSLLLIEHF